MAHACNPSYSRGRNQENNSSKTAQPKSSGDPISIKHNTKQSWQSGLRVRRPRSMSFFLTGNQVQK
jgi:hypothetical protein